MHMFLFCCFNFSLAVFTVCYPLTCQRIFTEVIRSRRSSFSDGNRGKLCTVCCPVFVHFSLKSLYLFVCETKIYEISFKDTPFYYIQYIKRLAAWSTYVQNYAIFPKTPKLPSLRTPGPVFVHQQNNISSRKRLMQTDASATLLSAYLVFSSICE